MNSEYGGGGRAGVRASQGCALNPEEGFQAGQVSRQRLPRS